MLQAKLVQHLSNCYVSTANAGACSLPLNPEAAFQVHGLNTQLICSWTMKSNCTFPVLI